MRFPLHTNLLKNCTNLLKIKIKNCKRSLNGDGINKLCYEKNVAYISRGMNRKLTKYVATFIPKTVCMLKVF